MEILIKVVCGYSIGMCALLLFGLMDSMFEARMSTNDGVWDLEDHEHPGGKMW